MGKEKNRIEFRCAYKLISILMLICVRGKLAIKCLKLSVRKEVMIYDIFGNGTFNFEGLP